MEGIVPLYYEMKKAKGGLITSDTLYQGMSKAYVSGNIGPISNLITIVHNNSQEDREEALKAIKWLVMETNFTIDSSKTLFFLTRPKKADEIIKRHTKSKLPNFFIYAKDKLPKQVEPPNNSTMNRIASKIPSSRIKFSKTISKFDYRMLMNPDSDCSLSQESEIVKLYDYWNHHQYLFNTVGEDGARQEDIYMYQKIRQQIIDESGKSLDYIVNTLVAYLYTVRETSSKKMLWSCFGDVMYENIKNNLSKDPNNVICPICGKRFHKKTKEIYCSDKCRTQAKISYDKKRYSTFSKQSELT